MRKKNTITFVGENKVICCKTECETEENTTLSDNSTLEQTIRDLAEESQWKCNYITKLKEEKNMVVNEMESKLNEQIEVQQQEIEKLDQRNTSYKQKLTDKGLEIKTVEAQTEEKHLARELLPDSELNKKNTETKKKNSTLFSKSAVAEEEVMAPAADPMKGEDQPLLDIHNLQEAFQRNESLEEEKEDKENS
ncbi:hypothetical protein JTB14_007124 [Gonioctena quinquepunctata]|nr:hypothetical protein JTB14_007124 [Gonioctena quinquepunctata]